METTRASLLLRIRSNDDRSAWEQFDAIYRPIMRRFAIMRGLSPTDVDDVVQDCMAAIREHIRTFDYDPSKGRFRAWLRTMVNNRCRNLARNRREVGERSRTFEIPQQREPTPEAAFDRLWLEEHLRYCLTMLRREFLEEEIDAYDRLAIEGWSVEQVCESSEKSPDEVYRLKYRVSQRLREMLHAITG